MEQEDSINECIKRAKEYNDFIQNQKVFTWSKVKFPALVSSINNGVMRVAYHFEIDEDHNGRLYGGYHASYEKDSIGLSSNFILLFELTEELMAEMHIRNKKGN